MNNNISKGVVIGIAARDIKKGQLVMYSFTGKNTIDIIQKQEVLQVG